MSGLSAGLSNPNSYGNACYLDSMPADCTRALLMLNHGAAHLDLNIHEMGQNLPPGSPFFPVNNGEHFGYSDYFLGNLGPGGQGTTTANPQKPPTLKNATQGQQTRFNEAFNELLRRLQENNGDNPCAKFFGGLKNALGALKQTKFSVGSTVDPLAFAETKGKKVTLNPNNGFFDTSGSFSMQVGVTFSPAGTGSIPYLPVSVLLGNVEAAAFALLHELGHRTGKLDPDDDSTGISSVLNSGKIREACFGETLTKQ